VPCFVGGRRIRKLPVIRSAGNPGRIFLKELGFFRMKIEEKKDGN
jgi:hypothetical protein